MVITVIMLMMVMMVMNVMRGNQVDRRYSGKRDGGDLILLAPSSHANPNPFLSTGHFQSRLGKEITAFLVKSNYVRVIIGIQSNSIAGRFFFENLFPAFDNQMI